LPISCNDDDDDNDNDDNDDNDGIDINDDVNWIILNSINTKYDNDGNDILFILIISL
jgi:hypothetical protein